MQVKLEKKKKGIREEVQVVSR